MFAVAVNLCVELSPANHPLCRVVHSISAML